MSDSGWQSDGATPTSNMSPICGDGITVGTDTCDAGANPGCDGTCTGEAVGYNCTGTDPTVCVVHCGDGIQLGTEQCDDANSVQYDGCFNCMDEVGWTCTLD